MVNPCLQSDRAKEIQERSKKQSRWGSGEFFRFTNWPAIAFDLDHTLVRYQIRPLFKLCYEQVVHFLKTNVHEYRNLEFRPFGEMDLKFAQRGIYYDRQRGFMLKLDENGDIMQAFYGTEEMSLTEIKDDYAGCRQLITLRHGPFIRPEGSSVTQPLLHCFDDFFTVGTIYLLMELVQFTKDGKLIHYGFERPFRYLMAAYSAIFAKDDFQKRQHGFFSALTERPTEYLYRASFLFKKWLGRLRRRNIAVIVITNSAADFAHFLLDFGIGDDWRKYIDALVTDARKPYFFSFTRRPFYLMNGTQEVREAIPSDFTVPMYLSQGSMAEMKYVIKGATDHLTHRMLYVGDSLVNELYACYLLKNCGLIGVAEELEAECGSAWGPFLGSEAKPTFWRKKLEEWLTALVASVEKLAGGKPDEDIRASTKFLRIFKSGNGNKKSPAR